MHLFAKTYNFDNEIKTSLQKLNSAIANMATVAMSSVDVLYWSTANRTFAAPMCAIMEKRPLNTIMYLLPVDD
jgi:hypothetical protein